MLIIGCGNADRGDDAAGILVARKLRQIGFHAVELPGDSFSLMEAWSGRQEVILVDAVVTGSPRGTVHECDARSAQVILGRGYSTHGFGVAEAIELSRSLGTLPASLVIFGIEGEVFEGIEPHPSILRAVDEVVARIASQLAPPAKNPSA